jgi:hypothetical protein
MPYKDPQIRKEKAREYVKLYRSRLSAEDREKQKKQQREHKRDVLASMSSEQKANFYRSRHQKVYEKNAWRPAETY